MEDENGAGRTVQTAVRLTVQAELTSAKVARYWFRILSEALLKACLLIVRAKEDSRVHQAKITSCVRFGLQLLLASKVVPSISDQDEAQLTEERFGCLRKLTVDLLREIHLDPKGNEGKLLPAALQEIEVNRTIFTKEHAEHVSSLITKVLQDVEAKGAIAQLEEFGAKLASLLEENKDPQPMEVVKEPAKTQQPEQINAAEPMDITRKEEKEEEKTPKKEEKKKKKKTAGSKTPSKEDADKEQLRLLVEQQRKFFDELDQFEMEGLHKHKSKSKQKAAEETQKPATPKAAAPTCQIESPAPDPTQSQLVTPKRVHFDVADDDNASNTAGQPVDEEEYIPATQPSPPKKKSKKEVDLDWLKRKMNALYSTSSPSPAKKPTTSPAKQAYVTDKTRSVPAAAPIVVKPPSDNDIVVSFTGFSGGNEALEAELTEKVCKLGGRVISGDMINSEMTHVISCSNKRTTKTIAAAICGFWLATPAWIQESAKAGHFLPTSDFGYKPPAQLFDHKTFRMTREFIRDNKPALVEHCKVFIALGNGVLVPEGTTDPTDFSLVSNSQYNGTTSQTPGISFTLKRFLDFIQPSTLPL